MRPNMDEYCMSIADMCATRSTCPRKQVGAVVARAGRILATGYNGSMPGEAHCTDEGCLMVNNHCVRTIHAEVNAVAQAAQIGTSLTGATLYCTLFPCWGCFKVIVSAGINEVVYYEDYKNNLHIRPAGIVVRKLDQGE